MKKKKKNLRKSIFKNQSKAKKKSKKIIKKSKKIKIKNKDIVYRILKARANKILK